MRTPIRHLKILIIICVTLAGLLFSQPSDSLITHFDQNIKLNAYVEESKVPLNRLVNLRIELSWPGKLNRYQIEPVSQPILTNLLLEGSGSENRLVTRPDGSLQSIKAITYRLRPLEMGMAYIDGLVIRYVDRESGDEDNLSSQRIMVEILEALPEEGDHQFRAIVYILLLVIFFGIIAYFIFLYFRKRHLARRSAVPVISLAETCLNQLSQEVDPRGTNLDEMINRLSKIFREYLDREFKLPARELSNREIIEQLESIDIDKIDQQNLTAVFEKLDVIKFARKDIDPNEFSHIYGTIENFLLKRKQLFEFRSSEVKEEK